MVITSRNQENVDAAQRELAVLGGSVGGFACDVSDSASVQRVMKYVLDKYGPVDILVNNAGVTKDNLLALMGEEDWDEVIRTNLKGAFNCTKAVIRGMIKKRWGRILNVSSVIGLKGNAGQANYAASKAGLIGFTKSLALELAPRNITANAIAPGFIETAMTAKIPEAERAKALERIPLGRFGSPQEVASLIAFLVSDEAGYITGQVISIDGGLLTA